MCELGQLVSECGGIDDQIVIDPFHAFTHFTHSPIHQVTHLRGSMCRASPRRGRVIRIEQRREFAEHHRGGTPDEMAADVEVGVINHDAEAGLP